MIAAHVQLDLTPADDLKASGLRLATLKGISKAAAPVKAAAVEHAAAVKRFGFLSKAIRIRTRTYPGDRVVAVVGPSAKYTRKKGVYSRGKRKGQPRLYRPAKYGHLANQGTGRSAGNRWLDQASAEAAPGFVDNAPRYVAAEIENQLARRAT